MIGSSQPWHGGPPGPPYYGANPQPGPGSGLPPVASFGRRLGARVLDFTLIGMFVFLFFILVSLISEVSVGAGRDISDAYFEAWVFLFVFGAGPLLFCYDWVCNAGRGRTPGKAMAGIRVVAESGERLTQGQALGRAALFGLPQTVPCVGTMFTAIDCLCSLADPRTMLTLHDRAAGTVVVRT